MSSTWYAVRSTKRALGLYNTHLKMCRDTNNVILSNFFQGFTFSVKVFAEHCRTHLCLVKKDIYLNQSVILYTAQQNRHKTNTPMTRIQRVHAGSGKEAKCYNACESLCYLLHCWGASCELCEAFLLWISVTFCNCSLTVFSILYEAQQDRVAFIQQPGEMTTHCVKTLQLSLL